MGVRPARLLLLALAAGAGLALLAAVLGAAGRAAEAAGALTPAGVLDCRVGYAQVRRVLGTYPQSLLDALAAGQYVNFMTALTPSRPGGIEYFQMLRLHQLKTGPNWNDPYVVPYTYTVAPSRAEIVRIAQARPGSLWLIGNEIDRRDWPGCGGTCRQDEMLPELYAQAYHELHTLLTSADPSARIANAGVIQATPLRLEYLTRMWDEYLRRYDAPMPVDVWNVHGFVFREKRYYEGCPDCWGADVPPGIDVPNGRLYEAPDTISVTLFAEQLVAFRRWTAERGERDKPLLVSEYGIFPLRYYPPGAGIQYVLTGTFNYMSTATDPATGYPGDANRLVQRWVYFSLDDDGPYAGAHLVDPVLGELTDLGRAWVDFVAAPPNGFVPRLPNYRPVAIRTEPAAPYSPDGQPVTVTVYADIANNGSISVTLPVTVRIADSQWPLAGLTAVGGIDGCGGRALSAGVTFSGLRPGVHIVAVQADSTNAVAERDEVDNTGNFRLLIATERVFLPQISWNRRDTPP
jgi:hypothetical protein